MSIKKTEDDCIGFTGTQKGMTVPQLLKFLHLFSQITVDQLDPHLHHGDCIGADAQAHEVARALQVVVIGHPPINESKRAFCKFDESFDPKDYIERNHEIVDSTDYIFACPSTLEERLRSGTWATVRYARHKMKRVIIIYPDGSIG